MKLIRLLCAFVLIIGFCNILAADRPLLSQDEITFQEWWQNEKKIAGSSIIKGVYTNPFDIGLKKPLLTLSGLNKQDKFVCIFFEFISGSYLAEAQVSPSHYASSIDLELPMEVALARLSPLTDELATTAWVSKVEKCGSIIHAKDKEYLLLNWNGEVSKSVRFLVNLAPGSTAKLMIKGNKKAYHCQDIDLTNSFRPNRAVHSYSMVCEAQLPPTCKLKNPFELIIDIGNQREGVSGILRRECKRF